MSLKKKTTFHIVPHSHMDLGWLSTGEEYYMKNVKYIFTNVLNALERNTKRTFTISDIAFFEMWWKDQTIDVKNRIKTLITNGQLEFAQGGWISPDTANPNYQEFLHAIRVGQDFLERELNLESPKIAWQIDTFGHSATSSRLFQEMGFEAIFFARMNETQKAINRSKRQMQWIW